MGAFVYMYVCVYEHLDGHLCLDLYVCVYVCLCVLQV